ncbi:uncharacterized protein [Haliotis cracherodii]|uniref:uncharacterized protein n=1 Tax=Haliotis cracherodii TaxID=6455 RepID=UPI0039E889D9
MYTHCPALLTKMFRIAPLHGSPTPSRQGYKSYSPTALTNAYFEVKNSKVAVHKTALNFSVPEQTLRDRIKGKINVDTVKSGATPSFDAEQETRLVDHVAYMASIGYIYTRKEVVQLGSNFACQLGKRDLSHPLSVKWLYGLLERWPELKVRSAKSLTELRGKASSEECINIYFDELAMIMDKYGFQSRTEAFYNVDEKEINQHMNG